MNEPYEFLTVDVEDAHQGAVMQELGARRGELTHMESDSRGRTRLDYRDPGAGPDRLPGRVHERHARHRA